MFKKSVARRVPSRCHSTVPEVLKGVDLHGRTLIVTSSASGKGTESTATPAAPATPLRSLFSAARGFVHSLEHAWRLSGHSLENLVECRIG